MPVRPIDTLLAFKAVILMPGLRENDRRVATVLIEHFNRRSGRCDPGIERIAELIGISTRTVIRATDRLVEAGLFRRIRHGGHLNHNQYEPTWQRFEDTLSVWDARFKADGRSQSPQSRVEVSPASRQSCHFGHDSAVTQTFRRNLLKETCLEGLPKKATKRSSYESINSARSFAPHSRDAAQSEAERRWSAALHQEFSHQPVTYAEIIELIDDTMRQAATDAEMRRRGAGFEYILRELRIPRPPVGVRQQQENNR